MVANHKFHTEIYSYFCRENSDRDGRCEEDDTPVTVEEDMITDVSDVS